MNINRRKILAVAATAPFSTLTLGASSKKIRIGWLSSLTGALSAAAIAENKGVQFAIKQINAAGGVRGALLELYTRDTLGDPNKAVNYANELVYNNKVDCIIGPVNSGEALATVPLLARTKTPNIVIGTVDSLIDAKKYPLAFRVISTNSQWIDTVNRYTLNTLKRKKIALISDSTGYGASTAKAAAAALKVLGITPVSSQLIDPSEASVREQVAQARSTGADVLMVWSAATGLLARILNARGDSAWEVPVVGHPALMGSNIRDLLNKSEYWNNTYAAGYTSMSYDKNGVVPERTAALRTAMRPALGNPIDFTFWWVAMGYDTVNVVKHVIEQAGTLNKDTFKTVLEETTELPGVYGDYTWSPTNHNGFLDKGMTMNLANTFKDGVFARAPG